jgi:hypothetical protein
MVNYMARTCIICGGPTGSREHIFPAALGGRRTNKGIYCGTHNNDYSDLAGILSTQLEAINAFLEVRGDHDTQPHSTVVTDDVTGRRIKLSGSKVELAGSEIIQDAIVDGIRSVTGNFADQRQVQEWIEAERAQGRDVKIVKREIVRKHVSGGGIRLTLGGPEGLRAIGYVAQTFLAHHFPDIARSPTLDAFKNYTLNKIGGNFVWWDFEAPTNLPTNTFDFGHRVLIGLDPTSGSIYARVSLFSALHFAVLFGHQDNIDGKTIIVDIDPLAEHPPNDILERKESSALAVVALPKNLTGSLSEAINGGRSQQSFTELLARISARNLKKTATEFLDRIRVADQMEATQRRDLFSALLEEHSQRILNLMRFVVENAKKSHPVLNSLAPLLDPLVAFDPTTVNGLSGEATEALRLAREALLKQMLVDFDAGKLDMDRIALLIGDGPGAAIVGQAIFEPIISKLPEG